MEITITGRHTSVTDPMKRHATEKVSRIQRHNDMLQRAEIVMDVEGDRHIIEVVAYSRRGGPFVARAERSDMYAAVDVIVDKLQRQVQKHKEKMKSPSGRQSVRTIAGEPGAIELEAPADED